MKAKNEEFDRFDETIRGLLPFLIIKKKLEEKKQAKAKHKKKRATTSPASRVSSARKKHVA